MIRVRREGIDEGKIARCDARRVAVPETTRSAPGFCCVAMVTGKFAEGRDGDTAGPGRGRCTR